jgi:hypothetical protein
MTDARSRAAAGGPDVIIGIDLGTSYTTALAMGTEGLELGLTGGSPRAVGIGITGLAENGDTVDGTFHLRDHFVWDYDWRDLVPHLRSAEESIE